MRVRVYKVFFKEYIKLALCFKKMEKFRWLEEYTEKIRVAHNAVEAK